MMNKRFGYGNSPPFSGFSDTLVSAFFCAAVTLLFCAVSSPCRHWFVIPSALCGIVLGSDFICWLRGQYDTFDPKGLISALGIHLFFISPLLVVMWEAKLFWVGSYLDDYRPWLGLLGFLTFLGLLLYKRAEKWASLKPYKKACSVWRADPSKSIFILGAVVAFGIFSFFFVLFKQGGISALLHRERIVVSGLGFFKIFGRSVPIFLMILITVLRRQSFTRRSTLIMVFIVLIFLTAIRFLVGGLHGSRSETVWGIFMMASIIHFFWRRLSVKLVTSGLFVIMVFIYFYGFYKSLGVEAVSRLKEGQKASDLEAATGRTFEGMLIGDMSRAQIQAYMIWVLVEKPHSYAYKWGETYWGHLLAKVPLWVWENPYNTQKTVKATAGFELQWGIQTRAESSSRVYGLAGEGMLNFGILSIPLLYGLWGFAVGFCRRALYSWQDGDSRFFLMPMILILLIVILISDSDNLMQFLLMTIILPMVVIRMISHVTVQDYYGYDMADESVDWIQGQQQIEYSDYAY